MADTKITALTALTAADPANDVIPIVDVSDTTMAASGTTKKISVNNILGASGTATLASATITGAATVGTTLGVTGNLSAAGNSTLGTGSKSTDTDLNFSADTGTQRIYLDRGGRNLIFKDVTTNIENYRITGVTGIQTWGVGGTTAMTLNSTGLGVGVTPAGTGGCLQLKSGITFPATQVASSDANTLDDYEEGTWTPTIGGTATYTLQNGRYVKIGNRVYVTLRLTILLRGTGSTSAISGIPFAVGASSPICSVSIGYFADLAISINYISAYANSSSITLTGTTSATTSVTNGVAVIGNGTDIAMSFFYEV
jgi:hypothetical protein